MPYRLIGPTTVSMAWNPGFGPDRGNRQFCLSESEHLLTSRTRDTESPGTRFDRVDATVADGNPQTPTNIGSNLKKSIVIHGLTARY